MMFHKVFTLFNDFLLIYELLKSNNATCIRKPAIALRTVGFDLF